MGSLAGSYFDADRLGEALKLREELLRSTAKFMAQSTPKRSWR